MLDRYRVIETVHGLWAKGGLPSPEPTVGSNGTSSGSTTCCRCWCRSRRASVASSPVASNRCSPFGRALMGNPGVLLLDEASEGLAPIIVQRIGQLGYLSV